MKNTKTILLAILIPVILVGVGICVYFCCFKGESLNNKELEEDKTSIQEKNTIVNAKKSETSTSTKAVYKGNGYTIEVSHGGDISIYTIYVDGKEVWSYEKLYPMTQR